ncbi:MAG: hypothetical protein GC151_14350 [Betaproteobacteria bacterium]|nr:hypothetical protein [Betaproteobacteria bacterium]
MRPIRIDARQALAAVVTTVIIQMPAFAGLDAQPEGKGSSISGFDSGMRDKTLASWLRTALLENGQKNVREAAFLFNSCFGGGMLDDIDAALGGQVPWVGGAASRHNQYAIGQNSPAENVVLKRPEVFVDAQPMGFWTRALVPLMEERDATVFGAVSGAATADRVASGAKREADIDKALAAAKVDVPFGPAQVLPEDVQFVAKNGGDAMKMDCKDCGKRYVVIWAGNTDRLRAYDDVAGMLDVLRTNWPGDPANVVFKIFYGDGVQKVTGKLAPPNAENRLPAEWGAVPAKRSLLQKYLEQELPAMIGPEDQFFLYVTDHGSWYVRDDQPKQVDPGGAGALLPISIDPETYAAAWFDPGNQATLTLDYLGLAQATSVYLNDHLIGTLPPDTNASPTQPATWTVTVDESDLLLENLLRIEAVSDPFTVTATDFEIGQIGRDPPGVVDEPAGATLVMAAAAIAAGIAQRRRVLPSSRTGSRGA